jgi:hypothetical protein
MPPPKKLRIGMTPGEWSRPLGWKLVDDSAGTPEWIEWDPYDLVPADPLKPRPPGRWILDDFVRIDRNRERPRWLRDALARFLNHWGPWGWCERGDFHGVLAYHMPVPKEGWRVEALRDDEGVPLYGPDGTPRLGRVPIATRETVQSVLESAARVNALRRIVSRLRAGGRGPSDDWGLLSPSKAGKPLLPANRDAELERTRAVIEAWLDAEHLGISIGWSEAESGGGKRRARRGASGAARLRAGGAAGGLAVAMLAELVDRPRTTICPTCNVTKWRAAQDAEDDSQCESCYQAEFHKKEAGDD